MKVLAVLESLPGVGKVKARRTMEEIGIADTRRVRGLGEQQRKALLEAFSAERTAHLLITISGLPGSGTTTVAQLVAARARARRSSRAARCSGPWPPSAA